MKLATCALQLWKFRPRVQQLVDKTLSRIRGLPPPTIGFHVRGGDKLNEDKKLVCETQLSSIDPAYFESCRPLSGLWWRPTLTCTSTKCTFHMWPAGYEREKREYYIDASHLGLMRCSNCQLQNVKHSATKRTTETVSSCHINWRREHLDC
jgi:hypothetical protein